jgi:hypothetical protein
MILGEELEMKNQRVADRNRYAKLIKELRALDVRLARAKSPITIAQLKTSRREIQDKITAVALRLG